MSSVKRVYVEKKPAFAVQAKELRSEIQGYLGIRTVTDVRVLIRMRLFFPWSTCPASLIREPIRRCSASSF